MMFRALFGVIATALAAAGVYHLVALFAPEVAEPSPPWRHALFAGINVAFAIGMLVRPRGFVVLFFALAAQQVYSHGTYAWATWQGERRVDWASALVLVAMPLVLAALVHERVRSARQRRQTLRDPPPPPTFPEP